MGIMQRMQLTACTMHALHSRLQKLHEQGNSLAESGIYVEALQTFQEILKLDPQRSTAYEAVSQLHTELEDDDAALQSAAKAVALAPEVSQNNSACLLVVGRNLILRDRL
jgi:tetratricopeptide (TPR) repeat protein